MTPTSVVTADQLTAANWMLTKVFQAIVNFLYTLVDVFVNFFTETKVLWALAVIAIIYAIYRKFRSKIHF